VVENRNVLSSDYELHRHIPRPGHADFTSKVKYNGNNDWRGGGHHSGRITLALVLAGVVAKRVISPVVVDSEVLTIGGENPWHHKLTEAVEMGDSLGGVVECRIKNLPAGVGEPFFNSVESMTSHIVFAIPGIRGIEFGDGFKAAHMKGSEHNDPIVSSSGTTSRNGAGGVNGGISNGNEVVFRTAIKPTSSITKVQESYNFKTGTIEKFSISGRHDVCFALRTPVVIEAAAAIALADLILQAGRNH
jgi:chorismate synthase